MGKKEWRAHVNWQVHVERKTPEEAIASADKAMADARVIEQAERDRFNEYGLPRHPA